MLIGPRVVAFACVLPNSLRDLLDTHCDVALFSELRLGDLGPGTRAGCELGPEEEVTVSEDDGDSDSEAEADEASAEEESAAEESEDEQSWAEEGHAEDHEIRALCTAPRDRRRALSRRYKRHGLKFSRPPPSEPPA